MIHREVLSFGDQACICIPVELVEKKVVQEKAVCSMAFVAWRQYCCFELY